jgi:hypothetical protein
MENHIWVEKTSMLRHEPPNFYYKVEDKKPFKQNHSPNRGNNFKKGQKRLVREDVQYPKKRCTTPLNTTLTKKFTAIKGKDFV